MATAKETPAAAPESPNNRRVWKAFERTNPAYTKSFKRSGGFSGTAINPTWQIQQMTDRFGPCGIGWGMTEPQFQTFEAGGEIAVFCTVGIWFLDDGTRSEPVYGVGGDKIASKRKDGTVATDDEALKKCYTDALGNAFKQLGMASDIHLGRWEDSKYVEETAAHFQAKTNPDVQPEAIAKFEKEIAAKLAKIETLDDLDALWRDGTAARLRDIGLIDRHAQHRVIAAFSNKKAELLAKETGGEVVDERPAEPRKPNPSKFDLIGDDGHLLKSFQTPDDWCEGLKMAMEQKGSKVPDLWAFNAATAEVIKTHYPELVAANNKGVKKHKIEWLELLYEKLIQTPMAAAE